MRKLRGVGGLLLALSVLPGCDTEQPVQPVAKTASLNFASYTTGELIDVWDRYEDRNNNGVLDTGEPFDGIECGIGYPAPTGPRGETLAFAALWGFSVEIKLIRAGQLTAVSLLPPFAALGFTNFPTAPDDQTEYFPDPPFPDQPPSFDPAFLYLNPRRMINTSSDVMLCTVTDLPVTNIAGLPLPLEGVLQPGDTIIVTAGRDPRPPIASWSNNPASFDAVLLIDGRFVVPDGTTTTDLADGIISFSYQVR